MDMKICHAIQDIHMIKETIEGAKVHYQGMYLLCFLMGIYNILRLGTSMTLLIHPAWMVCGYAGAYLLPILLLIGYLYIYQSEKKYSNKYYLSLLGIWGVVAIAVPVSAAVVNILGYFLSTGDPMMLNDRYHFYTFYTSNFSGILLFSILMIVCAYSLDRRSLIWLAVACLFGYMLLVACFENESLPFPFIPGQEQAGIAYHSVYYNVVSCFGYLALGFYLRRKDQSEAVR